MAVFFLVSFFCEMFCKKFLICAECVPTLAITVHGIASVSINILLSVINKMMEKNQENDKVVPKTQFKVYHNYTVMYRYLS